MWKVINKRYLYSLEEPKLRDFKIRQRVRKIFPEPHIIVSLPSTNNAVMKLLTTILVLHGEKQKSGQRHREGETI